MSASDAAPKPSVCGESQPYSVTLTIAYTPSISDTVTSAAPRTSTRWPTPVRSVSLISTLPSANVTIPIGTLMKKIQCQLSDCVRTPPASRPIDPPLETMNVYTLIAIARSDGFGNSVISRARTAADARAPPSPWMNRATINTT